jgi:hypothetical protein
VLLVGNRDMIEKRAKFLYFPIPKIIRKSAIYSRSGQGISMKKVFRIIILIVVI